MHHFPKPYRLLTPILLLTALTTGCSYDLGRFSVVATKSPGPVPFDTSHDQPGRYAEGHDSQFGSPASLEDAVNHASNGQTLTNARLTYGQFLFWSWADAEGNLLPSR